MEAKEKEGREWKGMEQKKEGRGLLLRGEKGRDRRGVKGKGTGCAVLKIP